MSELDMAVEAKANSANSQHHCLVSCDVLLSGLKKVAGVVESSQVLQVLSHVHMQISGSQLIMMASDSEVELLTSVRLFEPAATAFKMAVSCRKLLDVCRTLPGQANMALSYTPGWLSIQADRASFKLATLPPETFPVMQIESSDAAVTLPEQQLKTAIQKTHFAMAHQDVRFFLNGLHVAFRAGQLVATSTDGHRLARCTLEEVVEPSIDTHCIIPRKAILELLRLLEETPNDVQLTMTARHVRFCAQQFTLTTTLLEGQFPACDRLLSMPEACHTAIIDCAEFKQVLSRAAILSHEKFKGARLGFAHEKLEITANNAEQEKSEDGMAVAYQGEAMALAFNINYLIDVLNVLTGTKVAMHLSGGQSSVLLTEPNQAESSVQSAFLIMPLTL